SATTTFVTAAAEQRQQQQQQQQQQHGTSTSAPTHTHTPTHTRVDSATTAADEAKTTDPKTARTSLHSDTEPKSVFDWNENDAEDKEAEGEKLVAGLWAWKREKSNGGAADGAGEKVSKEVKVKGIREISHPAASLGARR
ncbi:hypothetical protein LTS18_011985, partial [Coniosporium uncinatum]